MGPDTRRIAELDRHGLREFGLLTGGIFAVLFGVLFPWLFGTPFPVWPWVLCGALWAGAWVRPMALRPVYRAWMILGFALNRITTPLIMAAVFFLMIAPVGVLLRIGGWDPLRRRFDPAAGSYRTESIASPKEKLEKPF